jgi:hypothetical protein
MGLPPLTRDETLGAARELLTKLRAHNEDWFWAAFSPYVAEGVVISDVLVAVASCRNAILQGDTEKALRVLDGIQRWHRELVQRAELDAMPVVTQVSPVGALLGSYRFSCRMHPSHRRIGD